MAYINESCGCNDSNDYQHVINSSPLLSGSQEMVFSPENDNFSFLENEKNNFSSDNEAQFSLDDLINMSKQSENNQNKQNNQNIISNNNIKEMNYQDMVMNTNESSNNMQMAMNNMNAPMNNNMNASMNNNNMNSQMNNNMNSPMNNNNMNAPMNHPVLMGTAPVLNGPQAMPQNVNPELQKVMNKLSNRMNMQAQVDDINKEDASAESPTRFILKNFNIVLIVIIALAWNDVAKFYINRSIKFGNGNHKYYLYYALLVTVILYGTSKYIHLLN